MLLRLPAGEGNQRRVQEKISEGFSRGAMEGKTEETQGEWGKVFAAADLASQLWPSPEPDLSRRWATGEGGRNRILLLSLEGYHKANLRPSRLGSSGAEQLQQKCKVPKQ